MEIFISEAAAFEMEEAALWYRAIHLRLEEEVIREIEYCFNFISENPTIFKVTVLGVRGIILPKFPYTLYYRIMEDYIEVISFFHHKRNPKIWKNIIE